MPIRFLPIATTPSDRQQHVAKFDGGAFANLCLVLATYHRCHADAPSFLVAIALERDRVQALLASAPVKFRQRDVSRIEPRPFA
jgi:hypothetical protein